MSTNPSNKSRGAVIWFTGLSASGKSTLADAIESELHSQGYPSVVLDGDQLRLGLCSDLGFSPADRTENIRRVGHVAKLLADAGLIAICAFISPYANDRWGARETCAELPFFEVHVSTSLAICEERDPKGLYARARRGELADFTGIDAPYELPASPEATIDTDVTTVKDAVKQLIAMLGEQEVVSHR